MGMECGIFTLGISFLVTLIYNSKIHS
jgi:hypothetical protein